MLIAYTALLSTMILTILVPYSSEFCPIFHCWSCGGRSKKKEGAGGGREKEKKKER